ncbi:MAG: VTT domain-containing protein [Chloroflexota bacterium]
MTGADDPEGQPVEGRPTGDAQRDRVPGWLRDLDARLDALLPTSGRVRLAALVGLAAAVVAVAISASRLLLLLFDTLDVLAYAGLFVTNWVANGGLLVPVPGLRIVGWLMIVQQGGALDPLVAGVVGGVAMALGQTSLYVVAASAREGVAHRAAERPPAPAADRRTSRLRAITSGERAQAARARLERLLDQHGFATIVGVSLVPTPLTTVAAGMAGATGFGFRRFVLASLVGKVALGLLLAFLGDSIVALVVPDRR